MVKDFFFWEREREKEGPSTVCLSMQADKRKYTICVGKLVPYDSEMVDVVDMLDVCTWQFHCFYQIASQTEL